MKRCAYLSMDDLSDFFVYDELTYPALAELGWQVETVSWRQSDVDWQRYDLVVIRTPWDYQQDLEGFLNCLKRIERSGVKLENSLSLVTWNASKGYLRDLADNDIPILPTRWFNHYVADDIEQAVSDWQVAEVILKPLVSANADDTFRLTPAQLAQQHDTLAGVFAERPFMLQPFADEILSEGEYSLFYFGGDYSHAICKRPAKGDFRVQEEHGGSLAVHQPDNQLFALAQKTLAALPEEPLYARLDYVRWKGGYAVMEIELIEPSLYFNMDPQSPQRFANALVSRYGQGASTKTDPVA
ncbi:hypothetical protein LJ739_15010 [Aestuariibacter halophilus]|uniref:Prokaryotic glutathione synthetase ATP-binding domain-containing protein n=1 Tax=Fluctibacter halophilus TaxID=226011 RepID=A0ABS8GBH1_9ALTE|nr:hypothetical protein [Aestuariibacter halophilus]MCC2617561.1 hypothetical protein [Aestuariibacter halophilus]